MAKDTNEMTPESGSANPPAPESSWVDTPGRIRSRIEATRADMGETIDAIQERLSPQHLVTQAKEAAKEAAVGRVRSVARKAGDTASQLASQTSETAAGFGQVVRDNPIPAAMVGVGATWLLLRTQYHSRLRRRTDWDHESRDREGLTEAPSFRPRRDRMVGSLKENAPLLLAAGVGLAYWGLRNTNTNRKRSPDFMNAEGAVERTRRVVTSAAERATQAVADASSRAQEAVVDSSRRAVRKVADVSTEAQSGLERMMDQNPLSLAAVAFALGAAVGATFRATRTEHEWMGETRDRVLDQAKEKVRDVKETIKEKVQETAQQVQQAVDEGAN